MFESALNASWQKHSRRGWSTLTSFGLQAAIVATLLVLPLLRPQGLPLLRQLTAPVSLGSLGEPPSAAHPNSGGNSANAAANREEIVLCQPSRIPNGLPPVGNDSQLPNVGSGPFISGIPGSTGASDDVLNSFGTTRPIMPVTPVPPVHPVRVSHISEGNLVYKVLPTYPPLARMAHVQGQVVLQAVISREGTIENLRLVSGHPMLAGAAIEAVGHWRYRPYILNNEPVEVETQITVNFSLGAN
jgi:protein TonB